MTHLIIGVTGQDGSLLAEKLIGEGEKVIGTFRRGGDYGNNDKAWRLDELKIKNLISLEPLDINDIFHFQKLMIKHNPDIIYQLAGNSFVGDSFEAPQSTLATNINSTINILETIRSLNMNTKVFFASSSEIFDSSTFEVKNETSKMEPLNPYGISKLTVYHLVKMYREAFGLEVSTGIFFNHESPFRARNFVCRKISYNIARLKVYGGPSFSLGNIDMKRDWSSAEDFVDGICLIVKKPGDYVLSSGNLTSVRSLLIEAARHAGFDPKFKGEGLKELCYDAITGKVLMTISEKYYRKIDTPGLMGDSEKLEKSTGWKKTKGINQVICQMVEKDINRIKNKI